MTSGIRKEMDSLGEVDVPHIVRLGMSGRP
jgi:hypothetical protein